MERYLFPCRAFLRDDCRNDRNVLPKLHERFQTDVIMHQTFLVQHYPESRIGRKTGTVGECSARMYQMAYLPKLGIIRLRLTGRLDKTGKKVLLEREKVKIRENTW